MAMQITPIEQPAIDAVQIYLFQIGTEDKVGMIRFARGTEQGGVFVALAPVEERQITAEEMAVIMTRVPEGVTLYEAIKAELYALISPTPAPEE